MWKCKNCSEQIGSNFDTCWKCGHSLNGGSLKESENDSQDMLLPNGKLISQLVEDNITSDKKNTELPIRQQVVIVDINMPFLFMIEFMVKWAIASIPAILILIVFFRAFWGLTI